MKGTFNLISMESTGKCSGFSAGSKVYYLKSNRAPVITLEEEMLQHLDGLVATDLQSFQEMQRLEGRVPHGRLFGGTDFPTSVMFGGSQGTRDFHVFSY